MDVQDPLLHSHVVVANLARARDDGRWRALDGTAIYRQAARAARMGFTRELAAALLGRHEAAELSPAEAGRVFSELLGEHGLTKQASTFTLREVVQGWASRLPTGALADLIRRLAAETVADHHGRTVALHPRFAEEREQHSSADHGWAHGQWVAAASVLHEGRWTTPELLALE
jgi:hypothetical protein